MDTQALLDNVTETYGVFSIEEIMDDVMDYGFKDIANEEELINWLNGKKTFSDFGLYSPDRPLLDKDPFGEISIEQFFYENDTNYEFMTKKQLLEEFQGTQLELDWEDNTYNYASPMERALDFKTFNCLDTDETIMFMRVHTGIDARFGYTDWFALKFEDEYEAKEFFIGGYTIAALSFKRNNHEYYVAVDADPISDYVDVYATIDNDENREFEDTIEENEYDVWGTKKEFTDSILSKLSFGKEVTDIEIY